jgi:hypothetical protein
MKSPAAFCVLAAAAAAFLSSCATPSRSPASEKIEAAPSYSRLKMDQLNELARSDAPLALEALNSLLGEDESLKPTGSPLNADLRALASEAEATVEAGYRSAIAAKDFAKALAMLDSLKALNGADQLSALLSPSAKAEAEAWKERRASILADEAEDFFNKAQKTPALLVYAAAMAESEARGPAFSDEGLEL